jgi:hypothetical protein
MYSCDPVKDCAFPPTKISTSIVLDKSIDQIMLLDCYTIFMWEMLPLFCGYMFLLSGKINHLEHVDTGMPKSVMQSNFRGLLLFFLYFA